MQAGEIRGNKAGTVKITIFSKLDSGRFLVIDRPGSMIGPSEPESIERDYPVVLGHTDDPGHYKLLAACDACFDRMGIPTQARSLPTVRARFAAMFYLRSGDPDAPEVTLPLAIGDVEAEALRQMMLLRWKVGTDMDATPFYVEATRAALCEVFGFVEPPAPPWAEAGSYVFDVSRGPRGVHVQVSSIEDGIATLKSHIPTVRPNRLPIGLLYTLAPADPSRPDGLPCEACGRPQHQGGCGWAPCERCKPYLHDAEVDAAGNMTSHLWWCRLTIDERGCTCVEHQPKVPYWTGTREGILPEYLDLLEGRPWVPLGEDGHAALREALGLAWPRCAREAGLNPETEHGSFYPFSEPTGVLYVSGGAGVALEAVDRALEALAHALRTRGYIIERVPEGGFWQRGRLRVVARRQGAA